VPPPAVAVPPPAVAGPRAFVPGPPAMVPGPPPVVVPGPPPVVGPGPPPIGANGAPMQLVPKPGPVTGPPVVAGPPAIAQGPPPPPGPGPPPLGANGVPMQLVPRFVSDAPGPLHLLGVAEARGTQHWPVPAGEEAAPLGPLLDLVLTLDQDARGVQRVMVRRVHAGPHEPLVVPASDPTQVVCEGSTLRLRLNAPLDPGQYVLSIEGTDDLAADGFAFRVQGEEEAAEILAACQVSEWSSWSLCLHRDSEPRQERRRVVEGDGLFVRRRGRPSCRHVPAPDHGR